MKERIRRAVQGAVEELRAQKWASSSDSSATPTVEVSVPKESSHGDYSTNIALALARVVGHSPMEIAVLLKGKLDVDASVGIFSVEIASPGYLNFSYTSDALEVLVQKTAHGEIFSHASSRRVLVEFISANPTGPLHLGNGRGGFVGDVIARILRRSGSEVRTEYYINDAGEQITKLGHSVLKDENAVYGGDYIDNLHMQMTTENDGPKDAWGVGEWAARAIMNNVIKTTLSLKMDVAFDEFVSERADIIASGFVDRAIGILKERGYTFEQEGALWFRTTLFGDDKDRVLVKSSGEKTYFASDCGYLLHKRDRRFDLIVQVWGADHHGYVSRFSAAAEAFGFRRDQVKCILVQLVRLVRDGKEVRMSKRAGNVVTLDELIDRVGSDVARFFFLSYSPDTHMNFDMGLAEERSQKNPVYYIQYAHARLSNILRKAREKGLVHEDAHEVKFVHPREIFLARKLAAFPDIVLGISEDFSVHRLPHYAIRLADAFHSFYDACRVVDATDALTVQSRLSLVCATRVVLAEALELMGIAAPEEM